MRGLITGKLGRWDNVGCVIVAIALCAILAVALFGCASIDSLTLCGDVKGTGPVTIALTPKQQAALAQGQEAKVGLRIGVGSGCAGRESASPDIELCGRVNEEPVRVAVNPNRKEALRIRVDGTTVVLGKCEEPQVEAGAPCSSDDPTCLWPAPKPRTEAASCYDPWAGRCHPWEEAVRLGVVPPGTPFAVIAFHDERLAPCWRSAVGRAPSDPGPLNGRVTGRCGAEWESQWQTKFLPALEAGRVLDPLTRQPLNLCGPATREQALMATWECTEACQARVLADPGGAGLTEANPSILQAKDWPGLPIGASVQVGTWGCPWFVVVEGASPPPPPPPPPPPGPCPVAGESCRPPCPDLGGPSCPDLAVAIGDRIADRTADHRVASAQLLRDILAACQAPAPACPACSLTVPLSEIGAQTDVSLRREIGPLVGEIATLRARLAAVEAACKPGTKPPPDPKPDDPPPPGVFRFEAREGALTFREKLSGPGTARQVVLRAAFTPSRTPTGSERFQVLWLAAGEHRAKTFLTLVCTGKGECRAWQNYTGPQTKSKNAKIKLQAGTTYTVVATYDTVAGNLTVVISGGGQSATLVAEAVRTPITFDLLEVMGSSSIAGDLRWPAGSKWEISLEVRP